MRNTVKDKSKETGKWPCDKDRLNNEASVETFFLNRFIEYLNWDDSRVRLKESIETFLVSKGGRKRENYKPDYILLDDKDLPYIVIDAKSTNEDIHNYIHQCSDYSLSLNQNKESVKYFILSNGLTTEIYGWKGGEPILTLSFEDFLGKSDVFSQLVTIITGGKSGDCPTEKTSDYITIKQINKEDAQKLFKKCHKSGIQRNAA